MTARRRRVYRVECRRRAGWWAISSPDVPGALTQARRLEHVESQARDAIAALLDVTEDSFDLDVRPVLDKALATLVADLRAARNAAEQAQQHAAVTASASARALLAAGLTMRDAGAVLGLSHQRVAQLVDPTRRTAEA